MTPAQQHILRVLASRPQAATTSWAAWYPLRVDQVRGMLTRLYNRGLVEPCGWSGNTRIWRITTLGRDIINRIDEEAGP